MITIAEPIANKLWTWCPITPYSLSAQRLSTQDAGINLVSPDSSPTNHQPIGFAHSSVMTPVASFVGTASHQDHWPPVSLHSTYVSGTGTGPQSSFYDLDISTLHVECSSLEFVWCFLMIYAFLAQTSQKWPGVISLFHVGRSRMLKCPISDDVGFLVKSVSARLLFCKVN